jgi:cardiolipin synthase A/B
MRAARIIGAIVIAATALLLISIVHRIIDITRGAPLAVPAAGSAALVPPVSGRVFAELASLLAETPLADGNDVELLTVAETSYRRLFDDLRSARQSITLQSYYCLPGRLADTTAAILAERARAQARVLLLVDGYGCRLFTRRYGQALTEAGVEFAVLRPVRWYTLHKAQHRSHVRLAVIDGAIGYTGGFGLDDKWLYGDEGAPAWRETNVRFTGAAVRQAQAAFLIAWAEATGRIAGGDELFPATDTGRQGTVRAGIQFSGPAFGTSPFERLLYLTIAGAQERLYISNAYFLPNRSQRALLRDASRRGVDVRILTAGGRSDVPSTLFASRAYYGELLEAGIRIYEYAPTMMHAKTIVADGVWGVIGSMNFDNRSMRLGDELNLLFHDVEAGRALEAVFEEDLQRSIELTRADHARRGWPQRLLEQAARLVEPLL